jgi:hypothetical protein
MVINYREKRGEGEWQQYILTGPELSNGNTDIYWPTVCADGNTVHMVCVTTSDDNVTYQGIWCRPIYYKSVDGGKSWSGPVIFTDMPERAQRNLRADDYVISVRGNHVVFAYCGGTVGYMESLNAGETWTHKLVLETNWDWDSNGVSGPCMYPAAVAAAIGNDDKVHIAFSAVAAHRSEGTEPGWWGTWRLFSGLFTWNDGNEPMQMEDFGLVEEDGYLLDWSFDALPNYMDAPDLLGFDYFNFWNPELDYNDMIPDNYGNDSYISHPRLIAENGRVYLMYSSIIEEPMISSTGQFFRGVFVTVSEDNGSSFDQKNNTSWISYHPELFLCSWDKFAHLTDTTHNGLVEVIETSECGYPSMSSTIMNNSIVFTWENDLFPFPGGAASWIGFPIAQQAMNIRADILPAYYNTQDIWQGLGSKIDEKEVINNLKIYPNPAGNIARVEVGTPNPFTLTLTNLMGQVVYTVKGQQPFVDINVSNYPAGIYVVNVKTAHASASQKLIVK